MTRALILHHDANSTAGMVGEALSGHGIELVEHFICTEIDSPTAAGPLPTLDGFDLVVALGSRWSVYDTDSIGGWIGDELDLLRQADASGIPTLGICFGGQVLAAAHGSAVKPATIPEVGWHEVVSDEPAIGGGPWFQWHFDVFEAPARSTTLASSPSGPQAFLLRRNLGLQFHPELDRELLELWMINDREQIRASGIDPDELLTETDRQVPGARPRTARLVDWFLELVS